MAMTEEQERKLAIIEQKLKEKGVTMTPAQKAILISKGSAMMNFMSGETGSSSKMPKDPNPDKEAGPAKDLPNFPRDLEQNPEAKRQKEMEMQEEKRRQAGARKLEEAAKKEDEALNN